MSWFFRGQKVAAISDLPDLRIKKGDVFTVVDVISGNFHDGDEYVFGVTGLLFAELDIKSFSAIAVAFDARWFRPVVSRKTDISVFTAMLTPAGNVPVDA